MYSYTCRTFDAQWIALPDSGRSYFLSSRTSIVYGILTIQFHFITGYPSILPEKGGVTRLRCCFSHTKRSKRKAKYISFRGDVTWFSTWEGGTKQLHICLGSSLLRVLASVGLCEPNHAKKQLWKRLVLEYVICSCMWLCAIDCVQLSMHPQQQQRFPRSTPICLWLRFLRIGYPLLHWGVVPFVLNDNLNKVVYMKKEGCVISLESSWIATTLVVVCFSESNPVSNPYQFFIHSLHRTWLFLMFVF